MKRTKFVVASLGVAALLLPGSVLALTRDIADLSTAPLTLRQSVISQLSSGVIQDPYDEFLRRPYNLGAVNIERYPNLSPWPGQEGEQNRYVDFLIGNNGNSNVRNGADTLQGTYIGQGMDRLTWGVSAAYLSDDLQNSDSAGAETFADGEQLSGADLRFGMGYRISNRTVLGGGVSVIGRSDESSDSSFEQGVGGFFSKRELSESGVEVDFGFRLFRGEERSWEGRFVAGFGNTELNDFSDFLDDTGAVTARTVTTEYDIRDQYLELAGGYNRRFPDEQGEWQARFGFRRSSHELDNTLLAYLDDGINPVVPTLELLGQDPVTNNEVFASADTLFLRGWTQIFGGARLSYSRVEGSTQASSLLIPVNESIDDTRARLALIMGLRQPLWNEKFRLVARARADWFDESRKTSFDNSSTGTDITRTTTSFAVGIETVLNNMVFDLAWLFGGDPTPFLANEASRQTIDLDRLVISATFGW